MTLVYLLAVNAVTVCLCCIPQRATRAQVPCHRAARVLIVESRFDTDILEFLSSLLDVPWHC